MFAKVIASTSTSFATSNLPNQNFTKVGLIAFTYPVKVYHCCLGELGVLLEDVIFGVNP